MIQAVILAAGQGSRAWPYCGIRQKVTVPIVNVPMVRRLAQDLLAAGVDSIVVVTGHRAGQVRHCLHGLERVQCVDQGALNGPVHAALTGLEHVDAEKAIICCGDIVTTRNDLGRLVSALTERNAPAAALTADRPDGLTASWTSVEVDSTGLVQGVHARGGTEHPRFAGVLGGKKDLLVRHLTRDPGVMVNVGVGAMPPLESDLALCLDLIRQDHIDVHAIPCQDFFVDVDKPWHIVEANRKAAAHLIDSLDRTTLEAGAVIEDGADIPSGAKLWLGPDAYIGKGCHIEGSAILGPGARVTSGGIVGADAVLGPRSRVEKYGAVGSRAILGERAVVGHCAEFGGVAFDTVYLYHYCSISGLIGSHVDIGAATVCGTWRFDDDVKMQQVAGHKEKPECLGSLTYIGDHSRTGVNVMFMPGVKVGYYSCVGGGAIVYDDVPEQTLLVAKQEHVQRPWGPERYGG